MSFDLGFWVENPMPSNASAASTYSRLVEAEGLEVIGEDPAIPRFLADLESRYEDLSVENMATSPWSAPIYSTGECVIVSISGSRAEELVPFLLELASRHGVRCFNPQRGELLL